MKVKSASKQGRPNGPTSGPGRMWAVPFIGPGRAGPTLKLSGPGRADLKMLGGPGRGYSEIEWAGAGPGRLQF